jgi:branched-chain amino acid aminotransferase
MNSICLNGKILPADQPSLFASNRSYRYGDGLFETMKVIDGQIILARYHFERLFSGIDLLKYETPALFTPKNIEKAIVELCQKNNCSKMGRVRLSIFGGNGGLYDDKRTLEYLVECWPLDDAAITFNENGLVIDICPDAIKYCDKFSNLKSSNFLPYTIAALYAKENRLNDCVLLNNYGRIADSTIANVFIVKDKTIYTCGLEEGCINGVMRRFLLEELKMEQYQFVEKPLMVKDLEEADEVFLSNAIKGIRWVKQFRNAEYKNKIAREIYQQYINLTTIGR